MGNWDDDMKLISALFYMDQLLGIAAVSDKDESNEDRRPRLSNKRCDFAAA